MAKKLTLEQVRATAPKPNPDRFREPETVEPDPAQATPQTGAPVRPKGGRKGTGKGRTAVPLGVSLFKEEHAELDGLVASLRRGGLAGINRSSVIREALKRLQEDVQGLGDAERAASDGSFLSSTSRPASAPRRASCGR